MRTVEDLTLEELRCVVLCVLGARQDINNGWIIKDEEAIDKVVARLDSFLRDLK